MTEPVKWWNGKCYTDNFLEKRRKHPKLKARRKARRARKGK